MTGEEGQSTSGGGGFGNPPRGGFGSPPGGGFGAPPGGFGAPPGGGFGAPQPVGPPPTDALAIISTIIGAIALVLSIIGCCCYLFCIAGPASIGGLVTGIISYRRIQAAPDQYGGRGLALTGIILSGIALFLSLAWLVFFILVYSGVLLQPDFINQRY